ncbi:AbrB/MazE/SpoVT family DNA-binding domain-containing protein [Tabrizicola sp.]|uniref:AbrB/MazE/SpoVT family DNA-binding domain-containing protein n=1 Tax=Tabrizicola sp. TaxID=2005166 RepID=UPI0035B16DC7
MHTTTPHKVGESVMMVVPPTLLDLLHIGAGTKVALTVDNGRLVVHPQSRPGYTLDELLAHCDASAEPTGKDPAWINEAPAGAELI